MAKGKIVPPEEQVLQNETDSLFVSDLNIAADRIIDLSTCQNCNGKGCPRCNNSGIKYESDEKEK